MLESRWMSGDQGKGILNQQEGKALKGPPKRSGNPENRKEGVIKKIVGSNPT